MNPFKIIEGKYPAYSDLRDWSEDHWMTFLKFMEFFIVSYENSEKWSINSNNIKEMEAHLEIDNHPFHEFIWRMGQWKDKTTPIKYRFKINGMALHCLTYLKKHPALVSDNMKEIISRHPQRMAWCLNQFKVVNTLNGETVRRDVVVQDNMGTKQISMPSIQAKMMTSIVKIADIVEMLGNSISASELKSMDTKDKLNQIAKLMPILTTLGKAKVAPTHFTQINLNGSTKDIEEQMLNFKKKTE